MIKPTPPSKPEALKNIEVWLGSLTTWDLHELQANNFNKLVKDNIREHCKPSNFDEAKVFLCRKDDDDCVEFDIVHRSLETTEQFNQRMTDYTEAYAAFETKMIQYEKWVADKDIREYERLKKKLGKES